MLSMISMPGTTEMLVIGAVALLIFGKRLPDVARSVGRSFIEFKKGVKGIEDEVKEVKTQVNDVRSDINSQIREPIQ